MQILIFLSVFLPLLSAIFGILPSFREKFSISKYISIGLLLTSSLSSVFLFKDIILGKNLYKIILFDFIKVFNFETYFSIILNPLSVSMLFLVNIVSTCVHIYSLSYMNEDKNINRFFTYLSMFTFFMIILIVSDDFLQLFIGWEGVGLSSYLLISFWFEKKSASFAANKAFIVNRIGDFCLIIGIGIIYFIFHTINFSEISHILNNYQSYKINLIGANINTINLACLFIFIGCMGKSAQIGLHVWLADAMEGPTPVSALIHAATMVTAGVFLVSRLYFLFDISNVKYIILIISSLTAIIAALIACFQSDIKKIIAYSTCSQLGYMFMALAVSGYNASIFHLLTHGFFKALLFLSAGSIIHSVGSQNINSMPKSLFKKMPITFFLMLIGTLSITGIPPFSGFYSKDAIIHYIYEAKFDSQYINQKFLINFAYISSLLTVFITSFYSWKIIFKSFFNKGDKFEGNIQNVHESDYKILIPMFILSLFSFFSGFLLQYGLKILSNNNPSEYWNNSLESSLIGHSSSIILQYLPLIISLIGALSSYLFFIKINNGSKSIITKLFENKLYFDEVYEFIFIKSLFFASKVLLIFDKNIFDKFFINIFRNISFNISNNLSKIQSGILYKYNFFQILFILYFILLYIFFIK